MNDFSTEAQSMHKIGKLSLAAWKCSRQFFIWAFAVLLISIASSSEVKAAAGDLDLTFGSGGKIATEPGAGNAMAIQPDGKI